MFSAPLYVSSVNKSVMVAVGMWES
jgi:hypothetical protein